MRRAVVVAVNNALEHHVTLVYRTIFLGETLGVIERLGNWTATGLDTLIDRLSLTDLIEVFATEPDCLLLCADVHHSPTARYVAETAASISPATKIFVFGRATTFIPQYFARSPVSAVHESGDREVAVREYLQFLDGAIEAPSGVRIVATGVKRPGRWSTPDEWAFPKLDALPVEGYRQYVRDVYGDHYSPRISATIGKGCRWACAYCGATTEEGLTDRRRDPGEVVRWAEGVAYLRDGFSFHLYHPNLFADRDWVRRFSKEYEAGSCAFSWRGVTTTVTLQDPDLVGLAGSAGCTELAMGVETIDAARCRSAKSSVNAIRNAARNCADAGIRLKALVMLGYPGQTDSDLAFTKEFLTEQGMSVRFTGYTPLQRLTKMTAEELDGLSLERFDRRTYFDADATISRQQFFGTLVRNGGYEFPEFEA
jgi:hypothetical protein